MRSAHELAGAPVGPLSPDCSASPELGSAIIGFVTEDTGPLEDEVHELFAGAGSIVRMSHDDDGFVVDLCRSDGTVVWPSFARGVDELQALLAAEQRYLVEEVGEGSVPGATYADKAAERLRQWRGSSK